MTAWEMQPDETSKAFAAFVLYRDAGEKRGLREVYERLSISRQQASKWSRRFDWPERAAAWDGELDRIRREAHTKEVVEMSQRHANVSRVMQNKIVVRLQSIQPEDLSPSELLRWFDVAVRIERDAMGVGTLLHTAAKGEGTPEETPQKVLAGIDLDRI